MTDERVAVAPQARKILVVAPHPDDESLGCGGLISLSAQAGSSVYIVFVTDGAASHRNSTAWSPARLTAHRELKASRARACLGLGMRHVSSSACPTPICRRRTNRLG